MVTSTPFYESNQRSCEDIELIMSLTVLDTENLRICKLMLSLPLIGQLSRIPVSDWLKLIYEEPRVDPMDRLDGT